MSVKYRMRPTSIGISAILMMASLAGWSSIVPGELSVPPKVTINQASGQPDPTNKLPIRFTVAFTKNVKDFTSGDVNIGGTAPGAGTSTVTGSGRDYEVAVYGITGTGTVVATVNPGVAHDAVGNENKASTSTDNVVFYDITPPAATINQAIGQSDPTRNTPIRFDVVFSKTVNDFSAGDVTLTGTAPGTLTATVTGSGMNYSVAVAGMTGSGTVIASIAAGMVHDYLGNIGTASTSYDNIVTYDVTPPTISISAPSVSLTQNGPVTYTVTYGDADAVTLASNDIQLNATGSAYGNIAVSGTGTTTRVVTISSIAGDGTLGISIAANTASDTAGNLAPAAGPSATFIVDNTAPTISIGAPSAPLTRNGPVTYTVSYNGADAVTLAAANVTLNKTGTANGNIAVSGTGTSTRVVTISGITGNGTLGISIAANTASDTAGNNAPAAGPSATFTVDNTAPTISIGAPSVTLTDDGPVTYTVSYSGADAVTLAAANVTLNKTGTANGNIAVSGTGTSTRVVTISGITGNGTLGISVAANTASDTAGNNAPAVGPSATFAVDNTAPTISIGAPSATLTRNGPVTYTVSYSGADAVTLAAANVTLNKTGTANGNIVVSGTGTSTRVVTISGITGNGTLGISVAANTASDTAGNNASAAGPSATFAVDNTAPTISIGAPSVTLTDDGPVTYTVTYSGADVVTLAAANVTLNKTGTANGNIAISGTGASTRVVTISGITGNGTLGISVAANTASDTAGNNAPAAGPSATFAVDNTAPTISIGAPSAAITKSGPITYTMTYSGANAVTLAAANVTLNKTGTANGSIAVSGTGTSTRVVTISGITGNGTLGISVAANTASDTAGNNAPAAGPSATFAVDNTAPTISIGAPSATLTRNGPVSYTVTYSGASAVTLAAANVTLNNTGTANGSIAVSGTGTTTRVVTISGITGNGTLGISIAANTASDTEGNNASAAGPSATFTVDNTAPTISIGAPSATLTKSGPVTYTVTYSGADAVTLAAANITLNKTASANGSIAVSGTGNTTRVVTISGIVGNGTLGISIAANTASDTAGNNAPAAGPSATFAVNNTLPTISIGNPSVSLTISGPVSYTVTYGNADTVTLAVADVTLNKTGTANGVVAVTGSGTSARTVTISGVTGNGTLGISIAANTASDSAANTAPAAGPSNTFTVDNAAPTISIGAPSATLTQNGPVTYTVTYGGADAVTLATANITLNKSGTADGNIAVTGTGNTTRVVTISGITGNGTLGISIAANTASDTAGNNAPAAGPSATFDVDNTAPTISIGDPSVKLTNNGPVTYTVTYGGADTVTLANANITLNQTGTADGNIAVTGTGTNTRVVTISGITGNGTLGISIAANTASDTAGNNAPAEGPSTTFAVDNTSPTVTVNQAATQSDPTNAEPIHFTVVFSEVVTDFASGDVTLNGTAPGTLSKVITGSGTTYDVAVSGMTASGTVIATLAAGVTHDAAGNASMASTSTDNSVMYDVTAPTVTIDQAATQSDPTNVDPIHFTVVFSEVVTDFAAGDVTINGTAPGILTKVVTGSGATYDVAVSGMNDSGTVIATLAAGVTHDAAGNASMASTSTDNTVMYDVTAPTVTINQAATQSDPTTAIPIHFTVVFTEVVNDFNSSDVTLSGTAPGTLSKVVTGSGTTYDVAVSGMTASGTVIASLLAGVAHDAAGNASLASTSTDNTVTFQKVLNAAAPFASFGGGAGMTNQGTNTIINGDIGTTGASTTMTGFHDSTGDEYTETPLNIGTVIGRIYTAAPPPVIFLPGGPYGGTAETKAIADAAAADALAAFNYLSGLPTTGPDPSASGNLGGITVPPGVYKSAGGTYTILPGETLTLDAQGNDNARWVFQMPTSLTVGAIGAGATPAKVVFKDGVGQADNVYWQVGSAATINTGAEMIGTIIASAGITFSTAGEVILTTLQGRAMSLNASTTMVNTHINVPNASPVHSLSGQVQLGDFIGDVPDQQLIATVNSSANPSVRHSVSLKAQTDGRFTMASNLLPPYDVRMASPHFLTTSASGIAPNHSLVFRLVNGDANGDGVVNLFDYVELDSHYGSNDAMADLDGDGSVTLFDYVVVDQNFGATGK